MDEALLWRDGRSGLRIVCAGAQAVSTPLSAACARRDVGVVRLLLQGRADANARLEVGTAVLLLVQLQWPWRRRLRTDRRWCWRAGRTHCGARCSGDCLIHAQVRAQLVYVWIRVCVCSHVGRGVRGWIHCCTHVDCPTVAAGSTSMCWLSSWAAAAARPWPMRCAACAGVGVTRDSPARPHLQRGRTPADLASEARFDPVTDVLRDHARRLAQQ